MYLWHNEPSVGFNFVLSFVDRCSAHDRAGVDIRALFIMDLDFMGHGKLLIVRDVVVLALGGVVRHLVGIQ